MTDRVRCHVHHRIQLMIPILRPAPVMSPGTASTATIPSSNGESLLVGHATLPKIGDAVDQGEATSMELQPTDILELDFSAAELSISLSCYEQGQTRG